MSIGESRSESETSPLIRESSASYGTQEEIQALQEGEGDLNHGESFDNVPRAKRQLGLISAMFLIFNRVIGTGIFATPSVILRTSGSVGVALLMWVLGALIAALGTAVYIELGTGLPRSGGEKNYLEFIYRRPKFLVTCTYSIYAGSAAANSVVFGEYVIHALGQEPSRYNTRFAAFLCLTFILLLHGSLLKWGLRLQNSLALFKLVVLSAISLCGILSLAGVKGFRVKPGYEVPNNFQWNKMWEGSRGDANAFVTGLYNVIWSFVGYANVNYALSEVRDPVRTIKRAAPMAMLAVTVVYIFVNIAYFAVVSKDDILGSKRIVAALFFRNLFGEQMERALSVFIALSTLGNLLSGQFSQGRVVQELGREGLLPFSAFFASNKPFSAPLAGLFTQYLVSVAFIILPPPGDAYLFMISLSSYCSALINTLVSFGLLLLYTSSFQSSYAWNPPFRSWKAVIVLFALSNLFLVVVPLIPPVQGAKRGYEHLPYWSHVLVAFSVSAIGIGYWYFWVKWLPRKKGYQLVREWVRQEDGVSRFVYRKVPLH
ncbi:APC amino acid permease [Gymnopus androsaceus JB14]|uniref:APC amino acid permease n=1 Tax=Gymnopus androsaceus JB14 TaxID=1447944 RepID=A0A6A4HWI7_9AGAR|nr:APC amino acid permease [Gymnopus androsaceus JB14]